MEKKSGNVSKHCEALARVMDCICVHEYQDSKYGKGKRVMNPKKKGYQCTVCGRMYD